jgi:hypothetical protein
MTRARGKKPGEGKQPRAQQAPSRGILSRLPWFAWLLMALAIAGGVVLVARLVASPPGGNPGPPRAAIVDQLYRLQPNEEFIAGVTKQLEDYGFEVDLYQGDEITVDFYRRLPALGHKLIVFRAHSGLLGGGGEVLPRTVLFASENYTTSRYPAEQLDDRVTSGGAGAGQPIMFGITAKFVTRSMKGRFDDAAIIMMGCGGIYLPDMSQAFIDKGASVYLAWDLSVVLHYVDEATHYLVSQLCSERATLAEAMQSTMQVIGPDPQYEARLKCYPPEQADKTLAELLQLEFDGDDEVEEGS